MKSRDVVGNCRPKANRKCPREKALRCCLSPYGSSLSLQCTRAAEEQALRALGGQGGVQNLAPTASYISKTMVGGRNSYVIKGDHIISVDELGQRIQFPQFPGLTFSSMESAFKYFEAHSRFQKDRAVPSVQQPVNHAAHQPRRVKALAAHGQNWQFDSSLQSVNAKRPLVRPSTRPYLGFGGMTENVIGYAKIARYSLASTTS